MPRADTAQNTSSADTNRPKTRQRRHKSPPPIEVPDIDQDAAERKRLLNVLAQRRYRKCDSKGRPLLYSHFPGQRKRQSRPVTARANDSGREGAANTTIDVELAPDSMPQKSGDVSPLDVPSSEAVEPLLSLDLVGTFDPQWLTGSSGNPSATLPVMDDPTRNPLSPGFLESLESSLRQGIFSGDLNMSINTDTDGSADSDSWFTAFSQPLSPSSGSNESSATSFPDSYLLPMSDLTLMRAMLRIAGRINANSVWELTANSPFHLGTSPPADQLPATWQPTSTQLMMPHHPLIDLLPWPTARDRIICILSLPDEARPPAARGDLALVNFAYDIEDGAGGIRVWGGDPYDETCWEVGQLAFSKWWFIFERSVIDRSNYWRALRGAPPLRMETPEEPRVSEL